MQEFSTKKQKGVVLILTLVITLILAILTASSVRTTNMQIHMSRNAIDSRVAFQAAEAALLLAESQLAAEVSLAPYEANSAGKYVEKDTGEVGWWQEDATWQGTNSIVADYPDSSEPPRYIVEFLGTVISKEDWLNMENVGGGAGSGRTQVFRITALGTGKTPTAKSMIQSTYGLRL